ncbi:MAG: hypothetical protein QNJ36_00715 [Calothrix sp. MO_167.B42]|nr:hypothetical protein [Calothrix sp. MO_167.B42]
MLRVNTKLGRSPVIYALTYPDLTLYLLLMSNINIFGSACSPIGRELTERKLWQRAYSRVYALQLSILVRYLIFDYVVLCK